MKLPTRARAAIRPVGQRGAARRGNSGAASNRRLWTTAGATAYPGKTARALTPFSGPQEAPTALLRAPGAFTPGVARRSLSTPLGVRNYGYRNASIS